MTDADDAAQASGNAAYDRAAQSAWPPTEDDFRATGAAAGAAAGAVFGGPVGAAIGGVIGNEVGSFVYGIGDAIAQGLDPNRGAGDAPMLMQYVRTTVASSPIRVAEQLALKCRGRMLSNLANATNHELDALARWGAPITDDGYAIIPGLNDAVKHGGAPAGLPLIESFQRQLFAASAARIAECTTYKEVGGVSNKTSGGGLVKVGLAVGVGWVLLKVLA